MSFLLILMGGELQQKFKIWLKEFNLELELDARHIAQDIYSFIAGKLNGTMLSGVLYHRD